MTVKIENSLPSWSHVKKELDYLNHHQVVIGFFGPRNSKLLTIVGANEYGATIRARKANSLCIPTKNVPTGTDGAPMSPKEYEDSGHKLFRPKGKNVLCKDDGSKDGKLDVLYILVKQVKIPSRPFIRTTLNQNHKKYADLMNKGVVDIMTGKRTGYQVLFFLGGIITNDMKNTLRRWKTPPNAPLTISNKGSNDPLRGKGRGSSAGGLLDRITHVVI